MRLIHPFQKALMLLFRQNRMRRRSLLAGATASIIGGSYLARNTIAPSGRITRRVVSGISTDADGTRTAEDVLRELIVDTDPIEV